MGATPGRQGRAGAFLALHFYFPWVVVVVFCCCFLVCFFNIKFYLQTLEAEKGVPVSGGYSSEAYAALLSTEVVTEQSSLTP